jgi:hypothetical protein
MMSYIYNIEPRSAFYPGNNDLKASNSKTPLIIIATNNMLIEALNEYKRNSKKVEFDVMIFWDELITNIPVDVQSIIDEYFIKHKHIITSATVDIQDINGDIINIEKRFVPTYTFLNGNEIDPRNIMDGITGISPTIIYKNIPSICAKSPLQTSLLSNIIGREVKKINLDNLLVLENEFKYQKIDVFKNISLILDEKIKKVYELLKNNKAGDNIFIFCCGYNTHDITNHIGRVITQEIMNKYPMYNELINIIEKKIDTIKAFTNAISDYDEKNNNNEQKLISRILSSSLESAYWDIPNNIQVAKKILKDYIDDLKSLITKDSKPEWKSIINRYLNSMDEFLNEKLTLPDELRFGNIKPPSYITKKQDWLKFGLAYISDDEKEHNVVEVCNILNDFRYQNLTAIVCANRVVYGINSSATIVVALINPEMPHESKDLTIKNLKQISGRSGRFGYESKSIMHIY